MLTLEIKEIVILFFLFFISLLSVIFAGLYINDLKNLEKVGVNIKQRRTIAVTLMIIGLTGIITSLLTFIISGKTFRKAIKAVSGPTIKEEKEQIKKKEMKAKELEEKADLRKKREELQKRVQIAKGKVEGGETIAQLPPFATPGRFGLGLESPFTTPLPKEKKEKKEKIEKEEKEGRFLEGLLSERFKREEIEEKLKKKKESIKKEKEALEKEKEALEKEKKGKLKVKRKRKKVLFE